MPELTSVSPPAFTASPPAFTASLVPTVSVVNENFSINYTKQLEDTSGVMVTVVDAAKSYTTSIEQLESNIANLTSRMADLTAQKTTKQAELAAVQAI